MLTADDRQRYRERLVTAMATAERELRLRTGRGTDGQNRNDYSQQLLPLTLRNLSAVDEQRKETGDMRRSK